MSNIPPPRSKRIELRVEPEVKALIERAAHLRHATLSAYLLESAVAKAHADLKETETLTLSGVDRDRFFSLLTAPPKPNPALRSLFEDSRM